MKRRIISLFIILAVLASTLSMISCTQANPEAGVTTRVTVDVNPSVEFIVDDQNKVIAVTAMNDDGSILIAGETFIGKTPEQAVEQVLVIAAETGYLVKGNTDETENVVKISVSGDTGYAKKLFDNVEETAKAALVKCDVQGKLERVEQLNTEALRALALSVSQYTQQEIEAMDDKQLYSVIAQARVETALLLTEEMRNAYYKAKEYKISFAKSEETAKLIESLGGVYKLTHTAYKSALDIYSGAITALDEMRYELLVSPDSQYQRSLVALREAKADLLKKRTYTASLEINGEEYKSAAVELQLSQENYEKALKAYEMLGQQANEALEKLISALRVAQTKLEELEDTLFDENIEKLLAEKAVDIENRVNEAKDQFFAEFEKAHSDDIKAIENDLKAKKEQLKEAISAENSQ